MKLSRLISRLPAQIAPLLKTICIALIFSPAWTQAQTPPPVYDEEGWRLAVPGWEYTFPTDHGSHDEFQTEWWYFTGNLKEKGGTRRFSYQLTFFRQGITPPPKSSGSEKAPTGSPRSAWRLKNIYFAHFALGDIHKQRFYFEEKVSRGNFGLAFYSQDQFWVQIGGWFARAFPPLRRDSKPKMEESFELSAETDDARLQLHCTREKPAVFHGKNGVSQKSAGLGRATHYYSMTRLDTEGTITIKNKKYDVSGLSWFDKEFGTNQLETNQTGWDWFSIQLSNGEEIMLYGIRLSDGTLSEFSSGTIVDANGKAIPIKRDEFSMTPTRFWLSPITKARYPVEWTLAMPSRGYNLRVNALLDKSELNIRGIGRIDYWEGAIDITGTKAEESLQGSGFLEMTGYAQKLSTR